MFFFFCNQKEHKERKVKSGDYYTSEWWQKKSGLNTIHKTAAKLTVLVRKGIVEKLSVGENEIVRFMPAAKFCENDIVAMLKEM